MSPLGRWQCELITIENFSNFLFPPYGHIEHFVKQNKVFEDSNTRSITAPIEHHAYRHPDEGSISHAIENSIACHARQELIDRMRDPSLPFRKRLSHKYT